MYVGGVDSVDLSFSPNALNSYRPNADPWLGGGSPVRVPGGEHRFRLDFQGTGVPLVVTLALYVTPPGGVETLLSRQTVNVGIFETVSLRVPYTPTAEGDYSFRAVIEGSNLADPDQQNNTRTWKFSTNLPEPEPEGIRLYLPLIQH